ncbi:MAG: hypothetical protein ACR2LG_05630 [Actinomycetota bacterium]
MAHPGRGRRRAVIAVGLWAARGGEDDVADLERAGIDAIDSSIGCVKTRLRTLLEVSRAAPSRLSAIAGTVAELRGSGEVDPPPAIDQPEALRSGDRGHGHGR